MANGQDQDQENWKPSGPPSGWKPSGAPPGFGRPSEAQQAAALGPKTMQAAHAESVAPLTNAPPANQSEFNAQQEAGYEHGQEREKAAGRYPMTDMEVAQLGLGGMGAGKMIASRGLKAAAGPLIRGTMGAIGGAAGGAYGGRELGRIVGHPEEGAQIGATIGGVAGGAGLGGHFFGEEPIPEPEVFPVAKAPGPYRGPASVGKPIDPVLQAIREGRASRVPTTMPEPPVGTVAQAPGGYTGPASVPPNVTPVAEAPGGYTGPKSVPPTVGKVSEGPGPYTGPSSVPKPETTGPTLFEAGAGVREPARVGNEGSAARWTNEGAYELARQGNREALMTLERRGIQPPPNTRYVMGSPDFGRVTYNPREVTTFEPSGEPIRNMETPERGARARIITPQRGIQGTPVPIPETGTTQTGEGESALEQARRGAPGESPTDKSIRRKSEKGGFTKPITRKPKPKSD